MMNVSTEEEKQAIERGRRAGRRLRQELENENSYRKEPIMKKTKELPKLYRVFSVVPRFEHRGLYYKDVRISWW